MSKVIKLTLATALVAATATGALAATKKSSKMSMQAANSLASTTVMAEPEYFVQAKGYIE